MCIQLALITNPLCYNKLLLGISEIQLFKWHMFSSCMVVHLQEAVVLKALAFCYKGVMWSTGPCSRFSCGVPGHLKLLACSQAQHYRSVVFVFCFYRAVAI